MPQRLFRSAVAFVIVLVAYGVYALAAAPWIEPPERPKREASAAAPEQRALARAGNARYRELFSRYFPPDHWAHHNPKVLESDQVMVLIKDYRSVNGGQMELVPCVMLFFPDEDERNQAGRGAVILDAPQGAVLQFDQSFDLAQAKVGKLQHGKLMGPITVYSDMQSPGPEDDLRISTRDIQLTQSRIWTDNEVDFRLGQSTGHGAQMEIRLLPGNGNNNMTGINVGGLQSFELARDVKMHLEVKQKGLLPGKNREPAATAQNEPPQPPVEITCLGSFHFDLVRYVATFEDQVDVLRLNHSGPSDQLNCELLSIYFQPKPAQPGQAPSVSIDAEQDKVLPKLQPTIIEARGDPVIVRSPSTLAQARCQRLEYNLITRKISLDGSDRVMLEQGPSKIEAPAVHYQPSDQPGDLGTLWARGPGWLKAVSDKDPQQQVEVHWQHDLHLRRHQGIQVISLLGRPRIAATGMGTLTANELHLWLRDPPPGAAAASHASPGMPDARVEPDRMLAQGAVAIESPQLNGKVGRMEVWFRQFASANAPQTSSPLAAATNASRPANPSSPVPGHPAAPSNEPPRQTFAVEGSLVRMQLLMRDRKTDLSDLTIEGNVVLRETHTARPDELPLMIRGTRLQLAGAEDQLAHVTVVGKPAHVEARGMTMEGAAIDLDQETNRLWINGAGIATMPIKRDLQGNATAEEQKFSIDWQGQMQFDGRTIQFRKQVVGRGPSQLLQTEILEADLKEPIKFAADRNRPSNAKPEVHEIRCTQGVMLENRTLEGDRQTSLDRMQLVSLRINHTSGAIAGAGPGWLTTVREGGSTPLEVGGPLAARPAASVHSRGAGLDYLRVDFGRGLDGNLHRRQIAFVGAVRAIYGPVPDWTQVVNADDPAGLGETGVMLDTERLTVTEMKAPQQTRGTLELEALGNTLVEGRSFTARAHRMAYAQAKELLILEGDGQTDAQLWRQTQLGSPASRAAARKILFWRNTNRVEVDDARYLDLSQFSNTPAAPAPQKR